jgi:ribosome-associated protein
MSNGIKEAVKIITAAAEDKKANDIVILDIHQVSVIADYFVICHANSTTQIQAIVGEVKRKAEESGLRVKGIEGMDSARWVLVDIGDVVVHVFHRDERDYYNLERLWGDAKVVEGINL